MLQKALLLMDVVILVFTYLETVEITGFLAESLKPIMLIKVIDKNVKNIQMRVL